MNRLSFFCIGGLAALCLIAGLSPAPAQAQTRENAPLAKITAEAEAGDPAAMTLLGLRYHEGLGVTQDFAAAFDWFQKAAQSGNAEAQYRLGTYYRSGLGVGRDDLAAVEWLQKAADQGDPVHLFDLGLMYEQGIGLPKDAGKASQLYTLAAQIDYLPAIESLGVLYLEGRGVGQDVSQARALFLKAAEAGSPKAQNNLGLLYVRGEGVAQDYEQAAFWFEQAANAGLPEAQRNLGVLYDNGFGVLQSDEIATALYRLAAQDSRDMILQTPLFDPRLAPPATDPDSVAAYRLAAEAQDPLAQYLMGYITLTATPPDAQESAEWFEQAAQAGMLSAMANLGVLYYQGVGRPQDYVLAYAWLARSAAGGFQPARMARDTLATQLTAEQLQEAVNLLK